MRVLRDNAKGSVFIECESITEMIEAGMKWNKAGKATGHAPWVFSNPQWLGHPEMTGWDKFDRIFNSPWVKGMNLLSEMQRRIRDLDLPTPTQRKRRRGFNETSGDVDVDRVMRGEYACFSDPLKRDVSQPAVLRMVVPIGFHSGESADSIAWTCVAVAAVCDLLEASGRMVEMVLTEGYRSPYRSGPIGRICAVAAIKSAQDPLNVATLVNVLSPWFYRTIGFSMQDGQSDLTTLGHRGFPAKSGDPLYQECFEALGIPENTEMCIVPKIDSMESAESFIRAIVAKISAG